MACNLVILLLLPSYGPSNPDRFMEGIVGVADDVFKLNCADSEYS